MPFPTPSGVSTNAKTVCQDRLPVALDGYNAGMTKQRGEDPAPKQDNDDASPAEFIDEPENLPGDQEKKPTP
jgi:hypothetical protein